MFLGAVFCSIHFSELPAKLRISALSHGRATRFFVAEFLQMTSSHLSRRTAGLISRDPTGVDPKLFGQKEGLLGHRSHRGTLTTSSAKHAAMDGGRRFYTVYYLLLVSRRVTIDHSWSTALCKSHRPEFLCMGQPA